MGRMADNPDENNEYSDQYSEQGFWNKVKGHAASAGRDVLEKALWLFYALQKPEVPRWARVTIIGALGYFIAPTDAIPDFTPFAGFADDMGVLAMAVAAVAMYIDDGVREKAAKKLADWFGPGPTGDS